MLCHHDHINNIHDTGIAPGIKSKSSKHVERMNSCVNESGI